MKTILVDDEPLNLRSFQRECEKQIEFEIVGSFDVSMNALKYAKNHQVDLAFLDIEMPDLNGLELGKKLRELYPDILLIYVTAHGDKALDAMKQKADYFITKPYNLDDITDVFCRIKYLSARQKKPIFIRTFGYFDVFVEGRPVAFKSKKAKELLALLIDRNGGIVSNNEAYFTIWEDDNYSDKKLSLCRKAYEKLFKELEYNKISNLVVKEYNGKRIDKTLFDCDYYMFLDGNNKVFEDYNGEYMFQYSWAEETNAKLYYMKSKGDQSKFKKR